MSRETKIEKIDKFEEDILSAYHYISCATHHVKYNNICEDCPNYTEIIKDLETITNILAKISEKIDNCVFKVKS